jgi:hypothetical protein
VGAKVCKRVNAYFHIVPQSLKVTKQKARFYCPAVQAFHEA